MLHFPEFFYITLQLLISKGLKWWGYNYNTISKSLLISTEQRIQTFLRHCLYPGGQNAKNLLQGLTPIQEELLEIGQRFGSLIHHNRQVFGPYYSEILKKLLLPVGKSETGKVSS